MVVWDRVVMANPIATGLQPAPQRYYYHPNAQCTYHNKEMHTIHQIPINKSEAMVLDHLQTSTNLS